jgi:16S rRNA (guanine527-N7)-methyltransferase
MSTDNQIFAELVKESWEGLTSEQFELIVKFRECVVEENKTQNLTRLTSPEDFLNGHVLDVKHLLESGLVDFPALDLGSGCGVPGLLSGLIHGDQWVVTDAEGHKAEFLRKTAEKLGDKSKIEVCFGRAETVLQSKRVESVVARAVGPVERIFSWLQNCSTWNTLVLLKGPGWKEEWEAFQKSKFRRDLSIDRSYTYTVGPEKKERIIVRLKRVPRGTKNLTELKK